MAAPLKSHHMSAAFFQFATYGLEPFLKVHEVVYEDVVPLFYANMTVINDTEPIIQPSMLGTHIEFNLGSLCQILELPNEGDPVILPPLTIYPPIVEPNPKFTPLLPLPSKTQNRKPSEKRILGLFQNSL